MAAADRIAHQLYPLAERPPFAFERVSRSYFIETDGTTRVTAEYTIRAYERPLHFWTLLIAAEPDAPGIAFLDEIRFEVRDEAGDDRVAYLLRRNDSHRKEISIFFLPQISPQEPARKIVFSYTWPGAVKRLLTQGDEELSLQLDSRTQVTEMEYAVYFTAKLHESYTLQCQQVSAKIEGEELRPVEVKAAGHKGWSYKVKNAPARGFRYQWRFTAKRR
jgi:hypothetical protein